ncbi:DUF6316 family protein [Pseudomonas sp. NCHU5208]|uniref:DUF6316 family protein n=1 Tax=unclassified Pseudomonas TaxID=196821 RepID=UPI003F9889DF
MHIQRSVDQQPGTYFRSARVSSVNGRYFFSTREGTLEGPFRSLHDAERGIADYIERVLLAEKLFKHCSEHIDSLYRKAPRKPE